MWNEVLAKFVEAFLYALAPIVATFVTGWVLTKWQKARQELQAANSDLYYVLEEIAGIAVKAAEQAGLNGWVSDKKSYALEIAEQLLLVRGFKIDLDPIAAAIEAAVYEEFNKHKTADPVVTFVKE